MMTIPLTVMAEIVTMAKDLMILQTKDRISIQMNVHLPVVLLMTVAKVVKNVAMTAVIVTGVGIVEEIADAIEIAIEAEIVIARSFSPTMMSFFQSAAYSIFSKIMHSFALADIYLAPTMFMSRSTKFVDTDYVKVM
jgi:hypothetical protein